MAKYIYRASEPYGYNDLEHFNLPKINLPKISMPKLPKVRDLR